MFVIKFKLFDLVSKFSIKDIERLSGIKAHTLRIWEQRYNIIKPERTDTNIRWYSNEDLKKILNISLLNNHGVKISKICNLSGKQLTEEVSKLNDTELEDSEQVNGLIVAMIEIDETRFEKIISKGVLQLGFAQTVENIIHPFLRKIGIMWQAGAVNPAQEHFISNLIRQKLISAIDCIKPKIKKNSGKFLLFLPDGELHELSLLFYSYLVKSTGNTSIYLGQSVPLDDIITIIKTRKPDYLVSVFTYNNKNLEIEKYIQHIASMFRKVNFLVSGFQLMESSIKTEKNISVFKTPTEFKKFL